MVININIIIIIIINNKNLFSLKKKKICKYVCPCLATYFKSPCETTTSVLILPHKTRVKVSDLQRKIKKTKPPKEWNFKQRQFIGSKAYLFNLGSNAAILSTSCEALGSLRNNTFSHLYLLYQPRTDVAPGGLFSRLFKSFRT